MIAFEYLYNRRVPLIYRAPAICEFDFTGTGEPTIFLAPISRVGAPSGFVYGGYGDFRLQWGVVPGAICYSVYRSNDATNPYGPYTLVAECLPINEYEVPEEFDGYCYRVEAITPDGVTDLSGPVCLGDVTEEEEEDPVIDPPPIPPPPIPPPSPGPTCGAGSPPVPDTFLLELDTPEYITQASASGATAGTADFIMPAGRIATKHASGYVWDDCTDKVPPVPIRDAFISNCRLIFDGDVVTYFFSASFGCYDPVGDPPACEPDLATQWLDQYPTGICDGPQPGCGSCGPFTISPTDERVGQTWTFYIPGSVQNGACPSGGTLTMEVYKTHYWLLQPTSLTIQSFSSIKDQLFCVNEASANPQWNGVIDSYSFYTEAQYQCFEEGGGFFVGDVELISVNVLFYAGDKWTISIWGARDGDFFQVFYGEKTYGLTAQGNYGKLAGCANVNCITLV